MIKLASAPTTLAEARDGLGNELHSAGLDTDAFAHALVGSLSDPGRLVVIPGVPDAVPAFDSTVDDASTLAELRLAHSLYLPAIGGDRTGAQPGPPSTLVRVTVLGPVHVKELTLASEVIFTEPVRAVRRQAGCCVSAICRRFAVPAPLSLPAGVGDRIGAGTGSAGRRASEPAEVECITSRILGRLRPVFTSTQYSDPAYGQLSHACPQEIRIGADDGAEMGVFGFLKQPQRTANLQSNLEEYLRFGLEAGIFYVT